MFDLLAKTQLTSICFNQGGTALCWAPLSVRPILLSHFAHVRSDTDGCRWGLPFQMNQKEGLLVTGFEDGVVRLLELLGPQKLRADSGVGAKGDATLCLKQAFKPHNAPVTAVAVEPNGHILATAVRLCRRFHCASMQG